jgi:hypothetical protein
MLLELIGGGSGASLQSAPETDRIVCQVLPGHAMPMSNGFIARPKPPAS